jgi:hypothetical protein
LFAPSTDLALIGWLLTLILITEYYLADLCYTFFNINYPAFLVNESFFTNLLKFPHSSFTRSEAAKTEATDEHGPLVGAVGLSDESRNQDSKV